MKKIILSVVAVFAFGLANAQEVKFGAKVGGNLNSFRATNFMSQDDISIKFGSNVGFQAGGFAEIKVASKFTVQPELLFSYESYKLPLEGDLNFNLSYINVPVMAKYYASEKISLQVGPQIGFLVGAKAKFEGESEDIKDMLETINFGVNFGLGYELTEKVAVDFRYNLGLINIAKEDFMGEDSKLKTSGFSLGLGYKF
ncbi:porin family protein [Flavobacterium flavipallidum]|uniref:Porin family protein n=1 Tax=Flavobacterium flavipallidum TaxID=3139140 RepID=A0ABU9HQB3_9FLAO